MGTQNDEIISYLGNWGYKHPGCILDFFFFLYLFFFCCLIIYITDNIIVISFFFLSNFITGRKATPIGKLGARYYLKQEKRDYYITGGKIVFAIFKN